MPNPTRKEKTWKDIISEKKIVFAENQLIGNLLECRKVFIHFPFSFLISLQVGENLTPNHSLDSDHRKV